MVGEYLRTVPFHPDDAHLHSAHAPLNAAIEGFGRREVPAHFGVGYDRTFLY
jgi:hypothetical protein